MTVSLNTEKQEIHQFIVEWCIEMSMTYKTGKPPKPTANKLLRVGQGEDGISVMVSAFTGVTAFNVEGHTLHSVYQLISPSVMTISDFQENNCLVCEQN